MRILIKVTKEILEQSAYCGFDARGMRLTHRQTNIGKNCAIANAVSQLFEKAWVDSEYIRICEIDPNYDYMRTIPNTINISLPYDARTFIRHFDIISPYGRKEMQPISFEIDVPDSVIESIGISEAERIISNSLTMEKV